MTPQDRQVLLRILSGAPLAGSTPRTPQANALAPTGPVPEATPLPAPSFGQQASYALTTPGVQAGLIEAGTALAQGTPLGDLGAALGGQIRGQQEQEALARILGGEEPSAVFRSTQAQGLSQEAQQRIAATSLAARNADTNERRVGIEQQRADNDSRRTDLAYLSFESDKDFRDAELDLAEGKLSLEQLRYALDEKYRAIGLEENEKDRQLQRDLARITTGAAWNRALLDSNTARSYRVTEAVKQIRNYETQLEQADLSVLIAQSELDRALDSAQPGFFSSRDPVTANSENAPQGVKDAAARLEQAQQTQQSIQLQRDALNSLVADYAQTGDLPNEGNDDAIVSTGGGGSARTSSGQSGGSVPAFLDPERSGQDSTGRPIISRASQAEGLPEGTEVVYKGLPARVTPQGLQYIQQ